MLIGPPNAAGWPNPMSSISTSRTFGAPVGAVRSRRGGICALRTSCSVINAGTGCGIGSTVRSSCTGADDDVVPATSGALVMSARKASGVVGDLSGIDGVRVVAGEQGGAGCAGGSAAGGRGGAGTGGVAMNITNKEASLGCAGSG